MTANKTFSSPATALSMHSGLFSFPPIASVSSRWVIIVSSSIEWHSYRHASDALSFFCWARSLGVDTRHIILMLSHPLLACDSRNPHPGRILTSNVHDFCSKKNRHFSDTFSPFSGISSSGIKENENLWAMESLSHVDYCGAAVNIRTFLSLLEGGGRGEDKGAVWEWPEGRNLDSRTVFDNYHKAGEKMSSALWGESDSLYPSFFQNENPYEAYFKTLKSDAQSDVVIYLVGHGYPLHFKFNELEFLSARQLARGVDGMYQKGRFRRLLIMLDTCQAISMCAAIYTPNVVCIGSSSDKNFSYASAVDWRLMGQLPSSSDWIGELLKAAGRSRCYTSTPSSSLNTPSDRKTLLRGTPKSSGTSQDDVDFLFAPLTLLSSRLLPNDPHPLRAQMSFGMSNGLNQWSLGDFLCANNATSSNYMDTSYPSSKVASIPDVPIGSFLH